MKRVLSILCVTILLVLCVLTAGCAESQQGGQTGDKKARLISIENSRLKQQISSLQRQLQQQKDKLIASCEQEKRIIAMKTNSIKIEQNMMKIQKEMAKRDMALVAEIARLKAEIAELKAAKKE